MYIKIKYIPLLEAKFKENSHFYSEANYIISFISNQVRFGYYFPTGL